LLPAQETQERDIRDGLINKVDVMACNPQVAQWVGLDGSVCKVATPQLNNNAQINYVASVGKGNVIATCPSGSNQILVVSPISICDNSEYTQVVVLTYVVIVFLCLSFFYNHFKDLMYKKSL
jgi:hypothetical protein